MKNFFTTKRICRAAIMAAVYAALSITLAPFVSGEFQCRVSEALTVLPLFFPEAIAGLTVGCLLTNILVGNGPLDIVLGTAATLFAAITTYVIGRVVKKDAPRLVLGELPPILYNAFLVPITFTSFLTPEAVRDGYFFYAFWVGLGQLVAVGVLGSILYFSMRKLREKEAIDAPKPTGKVSPYGIVITLGSILPGIGAIVSYMLVKDYNPLSTSLAALSVAVLIICVLVRLFRAKRSVAK